MNRRSVYAIFIWHGFFLALTLSMINFGTVLPALVDELTPSRTVFGLLYSILLAGPYLFNVVFGHFLSTFQYRKPFLILGIYIRAVAFLGMAIFVWLFGRSAPGIVVASLFVWLVLFALSGGLAGLVYADIVGKLVPAGERGTLYAAKQFISGGASIAGGFIVAATLGAASMGFPRGYAVLLFIGFIGLMVASGAFWFIDEPPSRVRETREPIWGLIKGIPRLLKENPEFRRFVIVENLSGFGLMVLPFYMLFAKENFDLGGSYVGRYLIVQTAGILLSNLVWGVLSRKWSSRAVVAGCILVGAVTPVLALFSVRFGPAGFYPVFFLVGFMYSGRLVGFEPYLLDVVPDDERPLFLGIRGTLDILVALIPPLGGLFVDMAGFRPLFFTVTAVLAFAFLLLVKNVMGKQVQ
ncbi:MAG: MFS transporter [Thermovirgaceae bacterium]